ncbi:ATP-dependent DNA helicase Hrp3 [Lecanora helva]
MYQTSSSTASVHAFPNGKPSPPHSSSMVNGATTPDSESDLSEPIDLPNAPTSFSNSEQPGTGGEDEVQGSDVESSHEEDALGSDDPDYTMATPPLNNGPSGHDTRCSSQDSSRQLKRKAGIEPDDYMLHDPELYGLRRSGRPRSSRQIVDDASDDDDSGSDIRSGPPRKRRKQNLSNQASKQHTPSAASPSESDSDLDAYGGSRRAAIKKHQRRSLPPVRDPTPAHGEVRFSTRKAARVSNYNEDDDDMFDDEADMVPQNYWTTAEEDVSAIDAVLNHRLREGIDKEFTDYGRDDFEYYIKWQGRAHYHATWESNSNLLSCRGIRRLENYFRKIVQEDIYMMHDKDTPPEEKEKWSLDRERDTDALKDYVRVERVIGKQKDDEGETEYLVKWRGLFYDSCTWEKSHLVSDIAQNEIDRYLDRSSSLPQSDKTESNPQTRRRFEPLTDQPSYVKHGTLRKFQMNGLNFLAFNWQRGKNVILADEMGLGKTVQTVAFMNWLRHDRRQEGPFIVVVPLSTMPSWAETFDNWTPDINYVVYNGNETARGTIREYELLTVGNARRAKFNVLLTTYEYILADASYLSQIKWQFMAVDEAHRLKNRESQLYSKLLDLKAPSRLLITGTPMQNTLGELSSLIDFLMPGEIKIDENLDLTSEEAGAKIEKLNNQIKPYMLRRTKNTVENDIPPKTEKIIRVELSDVQLDYYKNILTRNYAALNEGGKGHKQSLLNIMMELKKASNHPYMFPGAEDRVLNGSERSDDRLKGLISSSGKMMLLDRLLTKLSKDNHRVLIFSQMVKMLDILAEYLSLRNHKYQRLDGTIGPTPRRVAIDHFNAPDSRDFCFLLSTRAGGLGINLMTADTVILFDSDWNPQADLQAMARAHRIGQTKPVSIYRLVSKETVEEEVLERARNKLMLEFITIQRGITDKDAKDITDRMARAGKGTTEPNSSEDISRILKRRGEKMFYQSDNQKKLEELDIDAVLENAEHYKTEQAEGMTADGGEEFLKSFDYIDVKNDDLEWDQIIPKDQLDQIKAEEKKKADDRYLANVIEQNAPRKRKQADEEREERAAKKRARDLAALEAADDSDQRPNQDPRRPLTEKEMRNLIRGYLRYGSIDDRGDELVQDARLVSRDRDVLKASLQEVIDEASRLMKEEQDRIDELQNKHNKTLTKKDRKAVLFDFRGVKRNNAETIIERPGEMLMLKEEVGKCNDPRSFRIPEASKGANYTCEWGTREDGMLCVGIVRHGYGAWPQIRDDEQLGLEDKFFLEEHRVGAKEERSRGEEKAVKSPGAVHLVRRADYLLSVLKEKTSNGTNLAAKRAVENHHRNNKKNGMHARLTDSRNDASASPARRIHRDSDKHRSRNSVERRISNGERNSNHSKHDARPRAGTDDSRHRERHGHSQNQNRRHNDDGSPRSVDSHKLLWRLFEPVQGSLEAVQAATKERIPDKVARAKLLRKEIVKIGDHVPTVVKGDDALETSVWEYIRTFWPNAGTPAANIRDMFERITNTRPKLESDAGPATNANGQGNGVTVGKE